MNKKIKKCENILLLNVILVIIWILNLYIFIIFLIKNNYYNYNN